MRRPMVAPSGLLADSRLFVSQCRERSYEQAWRCIGHLCRHGSRGYWVACSKTGVQPRRGAWASLVVRTPWRPAEARARPGRRIRGQQVWSRSCVMAGLVHPQASATERSAPAPAHSCSTLQASRAQHNHHQPTRLSCQDVRVRAGECERDRQRDNAQNKSNQAIQAIHNMVSSRSGKVRALPLSAALVFVPVSVLYPSLSH